VVSVLTSATRRRVDFRDPVELWETEVAMFLRRHGIYVIHPLFPDILRHWIKLSPVVERDRLVFKLKKAPTLKGFLASTLNLYLSSNLGDAIYEYLIGERLSKGQAYIDAYIKDIDSILENRRIPLAIFDTRVGIRDEHGLGIKEMLFVGRTIGLLEMIKQVGDLKYYRLHPIVIELVPNPFLISKLKLKGEDVIEKLLRESGRLHGVDEGHVERVINRWRNKQIEFSESNVITFFPDEIQVEGFLDIPDSHLLDLQVLSFLKHYLFKDELTLYNIGYNLYVCPQEVKCEIDTSSAQPQATIEFLIGEPGVGRPRKPILIGTIKGPIEIVEEMSIPEKNIYYYKFKPEYIELRPYTSG